MLDLQDSALRHIRAVAPDLPVPEVVPAREQNGFGDVMLAGDPHDRRGAAIDRPVEAGAQTVVVGVIRQDEPAIYRARKLRQLSRAFVHIDCDLYSSTVEVLDPLFANNMIADGCIVCFDDWNCNRASPRFGQRRAWREMVEKHRIEHSDNGDYAVIGHKFTIHVG